MRRQPVVRNPPTFMHLFINALAASSGSGPTYVRNVAPQIANAQNLRATILLRPELRQQLGDYANVEFIEHEAPANAGSRFLYEQKVVPDLLRSSRADVLISAGNFALRKCPIPQVLLSGNSLYLSADFFRDLRKRRDYRLWLDTIIKEKFAKQSIKWANVTVAPTEAFAKQLRNWSPGKVVAIHHGFDPDTFFRDDTPLGSEIEGKLDATEGDLRLLFVSHYNYYRNFETLFRALLLIKSQLPNRKVKLLLTCRLRTEDNPGHYDADAAGRLVKELGVEADIVELGMVPYDQLHHVYRRCNVYVTAAYAESFAHPLVEAMASGCPVIASDLAAHQEVCGDAAQYFSRFSAQELANRIVDFSLDEKIAAQMKSKGLDRARDFSWARHVSSLVALSASILR